MIDAKLFEKLKAKEDNFDFNKYKEEKIKKVFQKKIEDSIYVKDEKVRINNKLYKTKDLMKKF